MRLILNRKMKLSTIFKIFLLICTIAISDNVYAVQFKELNPELVKNCIGCRYFSILYDAISQGGYRVYTGLFNICMFLLAISLSFQLMSKLFNMVVTDAMQMDPSPILNLDSFWKDIFKKMLSIIFVTTMVFTIKPQDITKWTIDPIVSGGISLAREFINYGIKQINDNIIDNKNIIQTIQPRNFVSKINLGIIKLPLNTIDTELKEAKYCMNSSQMSADAKKYEDMDKKQNLIHSLPIMTKLDLMCLIQDISLLSKRYAGLTTYYILYMFNKDKIEQVSKTDKNANKITLNLSTKTKTDNNFDSSFSEENNIINNILTILFIVWICGIGITIYNIVKWFILDPLISLIIAILIPCLLLILFFMFGGAVVLMIISYYIAYLLFILIIPFYFIQPMFSITVILFAIPLIATAWAVGNKSYLGNAINTLVGAAIGIAVLCMVFVIAVMLNEVTFYTLYNGLINNYGNDPDITNRLQMFNLLIMALTNLLGIYIISNHSKIVKLFGGSTDNGIFSFFKNFIKDSIKKVTDVTINNIKHDNSKNNE